MLSSSLGLRVYLEERVSIGGDVSRAFGGEKCRNVFSPPFPCFFRAPGILEAQVLELLAEIAR